MSQALPNVTAIIVNWNTWPLLERALASLLGVEHGSLAVEGSRFEVQGSRLEAQPPTSNPPTSNRHPPTLELIVVDNGSEDGSAELVRRRFPNVRLIANQRNRGFAAAVNQGLSLASGRHVLLLNSDARLEPESLRLLVDYLDAHPRVAIVGPRLCHPDGSIQSSRRRFPTLATAFLESTVLQRCWPEHPVVRRYYVLDRSDDETQTVDWLNGACLLVRRAAIAQVGGLDERFFMYSEELDWCRRFKAAGWEIVYLPEARAAHDYGGSSRQDVLARHIQFNESKCRYFGKYHGPLAELALRCFLFGTFVLQLAEESAKLLVGHKPALRRERIRTIVGVLRYQAPRLIAPLPCLAGALARRAAVVLREE